MQPTRLIITPPMSDELITSLHTGDLVAFTGVLYTGRDAAHERFSAALAAGESLPFDPRGQVLYYVGPTPAKEGFPVGAAGPTTATRMDPHTIPLLELGLKGMLGKGRRSPEVREAILHYKCVYFGAVEGNAALIGKAVKRAEVIAYEDLGAEAVYRLEVEGLPAVVVNDIYGGDLYAEGQAHYRTTA